MLKTYKGSCHCGFVTFTVNADITHLRRCNCSICRLRGALNIRVEKEDLILETPLGSLSLYQWGSMTAEDYFCPHCGILPFRKPSQLTKAEIASGKTPFHGWAVNARCLTDLLIEDIPILEINGAAL